MYIRYSGFTLESGSRTYNFVVLSPPGEPREFTINVGADAFGLPPFKFQDGPGVCMARLKLELERETAGAPAQTSLRIENGDIRTYVEKNYPKPGKKWSSRS